MTVHLGAWPWASGEIDWEAYTNLPLNDKTRLAHYGGGVPFLGYAFTPGVGDYKQNTWDWLSEHGYRDAIVRLWAGGELPEPAAFVASLTEPIGRAIAAKCDIILQPANEPNLEYEAMGAAAFAAWEAATLRELRRVFPTAKLCTSPMAQSAPNTVEWRWAAAPNVALADYVGWHYYWGLKAGDDQPGFPESPEWAAAQSAYAGRRLCVTECGNWTDKHDVWNVLARWTGYDYIRSYHLFLMSAPNWPQFSFDDELSNTMYELCKLWRASRTFPPGATLPAPPPAPAGVDLAALTNIMHRLWATRERTSQEMFDAIVDYKRLVGLQ